MHRTLPASSRFLAALVLLPTLGLGGLAPEARGQSQDTTAQAVVEPALIRPGDVVRLQINREPEMSGDFPVDPAGLVVLPRLGEIQVLEETAETLEAKLLAQYRTVLRTPAINVTVLRRVSISGSVGRPGVYNLDPTMKVGDALAMAGGVNPQGDRGDIQVIRDGVRLSTALGQQTAISESILRSGDQIYVPETSWIARNAGVVAAEISAPTAIVIAAVINN